jgi:hypothetical protein
MQDHQNELGPIPFNLELLANKLSNSRKSHQLALYTNDILDDVRRILNDFRALLSTHKFYYLPQSLFGFYGDASLFGEAVAKKFPKAQRDIEHAGNCLALGEPTACVLHLSRAMEIAIRRLAGKLHVTLDAKDSWGMVLGKMTQPIKDLPDNTEAQKRKKEKWSEYRRRDPGAHGKQSYDEKEARDIFGRVRSFMERLASQL